MSLANVLSIIFFLSALLFLTPWLGNYLTKVFLGEKIFLGRVLGPVERLIYRICLIDSDEEMHWQTYVKAIFIFSILGISVLFSLEICQGLLPLNPQKFNGLNLPLAFNTAVSFVTNTNWQAYAGENSLSYLVQSFGLTVQNFISAGVGIAVLFALIRGFIRKNINTIGNFWVDLVRSFLYILLPLSIILAIGLVSQGVLQNYSSYLSATTMEDEEQILPMGPVASQVAIKQLGSNGGGFFGVNSAHPFENPTPLSNFLQMLAVLLIPSALVFMFGQATEQPKHALMIYLVMLSFFLFILLSALWAEYLPKPFLNGPSLLGKELRFGPTASTLWASATTASSNGSVNAMLDSFSPLAGGLLLLQILLGEIIFGGAGSGLYGMMLFVLLSVFLAGLMVGKSPEYLGKKIESFEMKMVLIAIIIPSAAVLLGAAFSSVLPVALKSLGNNGPHGLTEILYAFGSAANNNGSAFAGLNANTNFYNLALGIVMLLGRFGVIVPVIAIAGSLANKKITPKTSTSLPVDTLEFFLLLVFVIITIGALTFLPSLALGPLLEHFLMIKGYSF